MQIPHSFAYSVSEFKATLGMSDPLHVVVGARGAMGRAVLEALAEEGLPRRAVSRTHPVEGVETQRADFCALEAAAASFEALPMFTSAWGCLTGPRFGNMPGKGQWPTP